MRSQRRGIKEMDRHFTFLASKPGLSGDEMTGRAVLYDEMLMRKWITIVYQWVTGQTRALNLAADRDIRLIWLQTV